MPLAESDRELVVDELGREPTATEALLFENLWSEHCAYRSSRTLLTAFESDGDAVVVGPGDDAAVVAVPLPAELADDDERADGGDEAYLTVGIESHNHPSFVDPYDGAATGVGGIVRDTLSMGAYPIALLDSLYFGPFDRERSRYCFEGVVDGIGDYGNAVGVPTVGGSVAFHEGYEGNPLVNVACVGLTDPERLVTAEAERPGDALVLVGNATGRDGLGGAAFASEDLEADSATEDRPAVQVGDPYAEKRLIECNEALLDAGVVEAARDLGAAGLGGATAELVAGGGLGAEVDLDAVHVREPGMSAPEVLLSESQERMCYEVRPGDVDAVHELAERFDLGCSVVGEVTDGNYVCRHGGETVVDAPATLLADGAPAADLDRNEPTPPTAAERNRPEPPLGEAAETVLAAPSTASQEWVYRSYDHEVGVRTAVPPGEDAAVLALREALPNGDPTLDPAGGSARGDLPDGVGLALSAGAEPTWTAADPYEGARAVAVENATNLAAVGAEPLAAVDCLNGANPEDPERYGAFAAVVDGLADACAALSLPVVGGNVSLYNDSPSGPIPPTPTVAALGVRRGYDGPGATVTGEGDLLLVGGHREALGGSRYLAAFGGTDRFPELSDDPGGVVAALAEVATAPATRAVHDVSDGGLLATLAESVASDAGVDAAVPSQAALFCEAPGRAVVETTDPEGVRAALDGVAPVADLGTATETGALDLTVGEAELSLSAAEIDRLRSTIESTMG